MGADKGRRILERAIVLHYLHQTEHGTPADELVSWNDITPQAQLAYVRQAKQVIAAERKAVA